MDRPIGIPPRSGCYLFRDASDVVVYVGKATSLAQRLGSYFNSDTSRSYKTQLLMAEATHVEWTVTDSEVDALLLENELIKQYQPKFNMRLKDDKSFPFMAISTSDKYPAPFITRAPHSKNVRYFGPFPHVGSLRTVLSELLLVFPLRSCTTNKFRHHQAARRPCLLADIGKCSAPCVDRISVAEYQQLTEGFVSFFEGRVDPLEKLLRHQMHEASSRHDYESAARFRDALAALDRAAKQQRIVLDSSSNMDCVAQTVSGSRAAIVLFRVRSGRVTGRQVVLADLSADDSPSVIQESAITSLYADSQDIPELLLVDIEHDNTLISDFLARLRNAPVKMQRPQRGPKRALLDMAGADAQAVLDRDSLRRSFDIDTRSAALKDLQKALNLPRPPFRIECFDMSHLQGTSYVGSMVVFEDGLPVKSEYRRFNVRSVAGNDDVGAMKEVLARRLRRWPVDAIGTNTRPDLLIIDGGLPQLGAGLQALEEVGITAGVEIVALAKREELLYRPNVSEPVALSKASESLYLVQRIRDEAHRFAITFHRSKRGRAMVSSALDGIIGVGPARSEQLLRYFGSLSRLRSADLAELEALSWLPNSVARRLYDSFRETSEPKSRRSGTDD